jgi:hypothetical protein
MTLESLAIYLTAATNNPLLQPTMTASLKAGYMDLLVPLMMGQA